MTLNHQDAIARVTVDGLAVCRFDGKNIWDLAFLRLPEPNCHKLKLQVGDMHEPIVVDPDVEIITFDTENGHFPAGFDKGFFDHGRITDRRVDPTAADVDTKENFRWTIDLEDANDVPHGFMALRKPDPSIGLTRTIIHDAVFYTLNTSPENLVLVLDTDNPNPPAPDPPRFGHTNDEISADIFCNPGGRVIIKIGNEVIRTLEHRPDNNPWKICLTNLCIKAPGPDKFGKGDFQHFYEILEISKERFALWGEFKPGLPECHHDPKFFIGPGKEVGRPDCDTTRLGSIGTLDVLFTRQ